jgi:hypothetical protein
MLLGGKGNFYNGVMKKFNETKYFFGFTFYLKNIQDFLSLKKLKL